MESKIQIVDENDQVISHKVRSEVDYQNDIYRVAALWVTNSQGQVLIAQRPWKMGASSVRYCR